MSQKHKLKAPFLLCHSAKSHEKVYSSSMSHEEVYFLDALASLDLKLSVSESVIYRFQLAHLQVFQSYSQR